MFISVAVDPLEQAKENRVLSILQTPDRRTHVGRRIDCPGSRNGHTRHGGGAPTGRADRKKQP